MARLPRLPLRNRVAWQVLGLQIGLNILFVWYVFLYRWSFTPAPAEPSPLVLPPRHAEERWPPPAEASARPKAVAVIEKLPMHMVRM